MSILIVRQIAIACTFLCATLFAQGLNPDVIVGDLNGTQNYGISAGEVAYSIGTTSCNMGSSVLSWIWNTPEHPVIGQNLYRLSGNRFEQLGLSWLKHGFIALQQNLCSSCNANPTGAALGVGCSDPYSAGLNGQQSGLGPRFEVNAATGVFPFPYTSPTITNATLDRRLRVRVTDVDPARNAGARYFAEGQYIHPDDAAQNNDNNNASYRECRVVAPSLDLLWVGNTLRGQPAIMAWPALDASVQLRTIDVPNDGRFLMAWKAFPSPTTPGLTRYEVAVHNLNSHRSASGIRFDFPCASSVSAVGFKDVNYHSGEPFTNVDWTWTVAPTALSFVNDASFAANPNANALRWGTLYNFWFEATVPPNAASLTLFRPGTPSTMSVVMPPSPNADDYQINRAEMSLLVNGVATSGSNAAEVTLARNAVGTFQLNSALTGSLWEMMIGTMPLVPRSNCALTALDGQVLNLNPVDPALSLWWGFFQSPPVRNFQSPFAIPFTGTVSVQSAVINPAVPSFLSLSQATQITIQ